MMQGNIFISHSTIIETKKNAPMPTQIRKPSTSCQTEYSLKSRLGLRIVIEFIVKGKGTEVPISYLRG